MVVSYIEWTRRKFPDQPPYHWHQSEDVPFSSLTKPLSEAKVALISSSGVYHESQQGFHPIKNDFTYRILDKTVEASSLKIKHDNYDHSGATEDINCVFPYERMQELEQEGFIKEFSPRAITFMGRIFSKTALFNEMIPAFLQELRHDRVDAVLLVPV
jgi:D-proline reductase (dithiol) PrdB